MSFSVKVGDADRYRISVAGVQISNGAGASGYGEDEFLKIEPVSDSFTDSVGVDGTVSWAKTNDRRLTITLTFAQTNSTSNGYLSTLHALDIAQPNGAGIGSFVVEDLSGTTLVRCSACRIKKPAGINIGKGIKERSWTLLASAYDVYLVGGN